MRDAEKIRRTPGRNDPDSPEQQRQHPYDFVAFPDEVRHVDERWLQRSRTTGLWRDIEWIFDAVQPVAVGSGMIDLVDGKPTRMMTTDQNGLPFIPGTSIKGAIRAVYETATYSCTAGLLPRQLENPRFLPRALGGGRAGRDVQIEYAKEPEALRRACHGRRPPDLCAACALFGALGFRGRIAFEDARVIDADPRGALTTYERVPALSSGQLHRVGEATYGNGVVTLHRLWGRRWPLLQREIRAGSRDEGIERVQALRPGTRLRCRITVLGLEAEEVGGLLFALRPGEDDLVLRLGGSKPNGFGLVRSSPLTLPHPPSIYRKAFEQWDNHWSRGAQELRQIMTREVRA